MLESGIHMHHFVCCRCRRCVKATPTYSYDTYNEREGYFRTPIYCAVCQGEMTCVGKSFAPPRRHDAAGWKKVEWMISNGWRGYDWPTTSDMTLRQVCDARPIVTSPQQKQLSEVRQWREAQKKSKGIDNRQLRKRLRKQKLANADLKKQREYQEQVLANVSKPKF